MATPKDTGIEALQVEADQARGMAQLLKKMHLEFRGVRQDWHHRKPTPLNTSLWPGKVG